MTIIAFDGKLLAADSLTTSDYMRVPIAGENKKIFALGAGRFAGGVGCKSSAKKFVEWCRAGREDDKFPDLTDGDEYFYIEKGRCHIYDSSGYSAEVVPPIAWGCGRNFAMGAMAAGADACVAAQIAIQYDTACGLPVQVLDTEGKNEQLEV